jgi:hypothetical protein
MRTTTAHRTSHTLALLPVLSAGLLATAVIGSTARGHAASSAQPALVRLTIRASAPHVPKQLPAGILALTLVNDTKQEVDADLGRANPGATLAQINAADAASNSQSPQASLQGFARLTQLVTFMGGINSLVPGEVATAMLDLRTPGLYGLHEGYQNGPGSTVGVFKVTPGTGQQATLPAAPVVVRLKDMKFLGLPRHLAAGQVTIQVVNQGPSVHEMALARLDAGKTQRDVLSFLRSPKAQNGPPPTWVHLVGGMDTISAHVRADISLRLTPGYYVALCFMPDMKKGVPHVMEGMIGNFTVR